MTPVSSVITCICCGTQTCSNCTGLPEATVETSPDNDICHILNVLCSYDGIVSLCKQCVKLFDNSHAEKIIIERSVLDNKVETINSLQIQLETSQKENALLKSKLNGNPNPIQHQNNANIAIDNHNVNNSSENTQESPHTISPSERSAGPDCISEDLKAIEKMLIFKSRPEGAISISGRSKNHSSINVNLETAVMLAVLPSMNEKFSQYFEEITEFVETKKMKVHENSSRTFLSEVHYDVGFRANGGVMKVKMKVQPVSCRIQIQTCGPRAKFLEVMKIGHAEYFSTKFIDTFVQVLISEGDNIDEEVVRLERDATMLRKQATDKGELQSKVIIDRRCYAKCNKNVNIKNNDIFGQCKKCQRVEHFTCSGTSDFEKALILAGKTAFHCVRCVSENPSLACETIENGSDSHDEIDYGTQLRQNESVISRLQELLKQSDEKYKSLLAASNTELSDHRASYRALTNENEKLMEERDTLLKIYQTILKEDEVGRRKNIKTTADLIKLIEHVQEKRSSGDVNHNNSARDKSGENRSRRPPFCHYFNNNKQCPYEGKVGGCRFRHEKSIPCRDKDQCSRRLCQFIHPSLSTDRFLDRKNSTWNGGGIRDNFSNTNSFRGSNYAPYETNNAANNTANHRPTWDNQAPSPHSQNKKINQQGPSQNSPNLPTEHPYVTTVENPMQQQQRWNQFPQQFNNNYAFPIAGNNYVHYPSLPMGVGAC